jgi:hypothetical protein
MKPKPLVELNHLTVPVVMMNPFIAILDDGNARALPIGDDDDFEGRFVQGAVPNAR